MKQSKALEQIPVVILSTASRTVSAHSLSRRIRAAGGEVLTETESSCVVYGMPRSVWEEVPLSRMAAEMTARL
jgi:chemotaxis response regulator CheB